MRVINSTARTTVLRELALLRALCASLRDSRRTSKLAGKVLRDSAVGAVKPLAPAHGPAERADFVLGGPP